MLCVHWVPSTVHQLHTQAETCDRSVLDRDSCSQSIYSIVFQLALLGGRASVASPREEEKRDSCAAVLELLPGAGSIKSDC